MSLHKGLDVGADSVADNRAASAAGPAEEARAASGVNRTWRDWDDGEGNGAKPPRPLSRSEAQALGQRIGSVSPWRVVGVQALVGVVAAFVAQAVFGGAGVFWSVLYGAASVVVPAVLMARGLTSPLSRASPAAGVASFMVWEFVKIGVSLAMLVLAPKIVPGLSWPALLLGLVLCIKVYWWALVWRRRV